MSIDSQAKLEADIKLVEARAEKIRAEIGKIEKECNSKKGKAESIIEVIKVFLSLVIGVGGAIAAVSSFQLSKIESETIKLEISQKQQELDEAEQNLDTAEKELSKKKSEIKEIDEKMSDIKKYSQNDLAPLLKNFRINIHELQDKLPNSFGSKEDFEKALLSSEQLLLKLRAVAGDTEDVGASGVQTKDMSVEKLYYVIAMTSSKAEDIEKEIKRVKYKVGADFEKKFPNIEIYKPKDDLPTLLISGKSLPYNQANILKKHAIEAGFGKDTWLWQSNGEYFSQKK